MVDQELDALLVGALYGELGPADEARLAAHLESHPIDRTALDDMRTTRKAMADARFFELWFDPPPSVSALLVQEAARRAPRSEVTGDSWFARFARSFMRHPAMAAAAMLVVVVGVAGTLYMKKGDLAAPSSTMHDEASSTVAAGSPPASTVAPMAPTVSSSYGSASTVDTPTAALASPTGNTRVADGISADVDDKRLALDRARDQSEVAKKPAADHAIKQSVEVAPKRFEPKELAKDDRGNALADDEPAQPAQQEKEQQGYKGKAAPPVPPTSAPETSMATVGTATTGASGGGAAANNNAPDQWAADQYERVRSLVVRSRCTDAAAAAAVLEARAPEYYQTNVANDRALKDCRSYIAHAVEQQQEARSKAAAAKASKAVPTDSK
jgi:hypothetical protein